MKPRALWAPIALCGVTAVTSSLPALAQYANEFSQAKLIKQGKTDKPIAGTGEVVVQVQVNANGTHKVIKVIRSTNHGDDDAAMDIAQNSTYEPAHRGKTPVTAYYDFTLNFTGKAVAAARQSERRSAAAMGLSPAAAKIADMIRAKRYAQAVSAAQAGLLSAPGDESLRQMLGIAAYDNSDFSTAAAAFNEVTTVGKAFAPIAAASLASAAVQQAQQNPSLALQYAQKAVSLVDDTNSRFALGVAQLADNQNAEALATLKSVHSAAMSDPKMATAAKVNVDAELAAAYLASGDTAGAQTVAAEIKKLDPSSTVGARVMGTHMLEAGIAAENAKDTATALKDFDQAAAAGDPELAVTADTRAAFLIGQSQKPDYKQMQAYADKALALRPDDPQANFAEGVALAGQWSGSHDAATRQKALDALNRADQQAKAAGNEALSLQVETFIKQNLNATPGGQ